MLRYLTAGESHGKALVAILEGVPAGLEVSIEFINEELKKRRSETGVLLGSGFIAGEGITMVAVAAYAFITKAKPKGLGIIYPGNLDQFIALAIFLALAAFLYMKSRKDSTHTG